jgi:hypothetical protein
MNERWTADMTFLHLCLSVLVKSDDFAVQEELFGMEALLNMRKRLDSVQVAQLLWFREVMSPNLIQNFFNGYRTALAKYGLVEGNARIKEKVIEILLKNRPDLTRESLLDFVIQVNEESRLATIKDVLAAGIHLKKNTDGTYTEEE